MSTIQRHNGACTPDCCSSDANFFILSTSRSHQTRLHGGYNARHCSLLCMHKRETMISSKTCSAGPVVKRNSGHSDPSISTRAAAWLARLLCLKARLSFMHRERKRTAAAVLAAVAPAPSIACVARVRPHTRPFQDVQHMVTALLFIQWLSQAFEPPHEIKYPAEDSCTQHGRHQEGMQRFEGNCISACWPIPRLMTSSRLGVFC